MWNAVQQLVSWLVGLVDEAILLSKLFSSRPKFFRLGYGDVAVYEDCQATAVSQLANGTYKFSLQEKDLEWVKKTEEKSISVEEVRFRSPLADILPKEAADCRFHLVRPINQGEKVAASNMTNSVYVIMLPATGETGKCTRLAMARQLAETHGWSSIIVTAPYYGVRKPFLQKLFFIDSVKDILLQSEAIIEESSAICNYLLNKSPDNRVCFTGFSYGGAMSACASAFAIGAGADGMRMACAPYVGAASPVVLADGVISASLDWDALLENETESEVSARFKLHQYLTQTQLESVTKALQEKNKKMEIAVIKGCAMEHDSFVRKRYSLELEAQLRQLQSNQSKKFSMEWLLGGHVAAAVFRAIYHKRLIEDAANELLQIGNQ